MRLLLATLCLVLTSAVVRLGQAEVFARANTFSGLERAAVIEGRWNAARLEDLARAAGDRARARALLGQATSANPRQVSAWLDLGLTAESLGDFRSAEAALKEAARLD